MTGELEIKNKIQPAENLKIAPFRKHIRETSPHKHNKYLEMVYLYRGTGHHTIDTTDYLIQPPVVFLIRQDQVHYWNIDTEPEGYVLIMKKKYIEQVLDKEIEHLLTRLEPFQCIHPGDETAITTLFGLLHSEFREQPGRSHTVMDGLLKVLLAKLLQAGKREGTPDSGKETLYHRFKTLLLQEPLASLHVDHYARRLNTTPQNLNAACRKEVRQPASRVIAEIAVSEARRLLLYTGLSVTEIAYSLNFKDNSHFTKYFKRYTGIIPSQYRAHPEG